MKNCPMCNFENADTAAFCTQCGARLDERKKCPSCKALLSPDAVFCNNCGARVDGKTVCESCGTVYEGSFCPACGKQNRKPKLSKKKNSVDKPAQTPIRALLIITACLLFLSSFFVGYRMVLTDEAKDEILESGTRSDIEKAEETLREMYDCPTAVSYIVRTVETLSDAADALFPKPSDIERGSFGTLVIQSVLGILAVLANIVLATVCAVRLLLRSFGGYDASDNLGVCLPAFVFSVFTTCFITSPIIVGGTISDYMRGVASAWFFVTYIPALCTFFGALILAVVCDSAYRARFSSVLLTLTGVCGVLLSGLLMCFSSGDIVLKASTSQGMLNTAGRASLSAGSLFQGIFAFSPLFTGSKSYSAFNKAVVLTDIAYALSVLSLLIAALLCLWLLSGLLTAGKRRIPVSAVIASGVLSVFGIAKIVCDAMLAETVKGYLASRAFISPAPIVFAILSILLFGSLLTVYIIKRNDYDLVY